MLRLTRLLLAVSIRLANSVLVSECFFLLLHFANTILGLNPMNEVTCTQSSIILKDTPGVSLCTLKHLNDCSFISSQNIHLVNNTLTFNIRRRMLIRHFGIDLNLMDSTTLYQPWKKLFR